MCFSIQKSVYNSEYVVINLSLKTLAIIDAAHISTTFQSQPTINTGCFLSSSNL